MTRGSLYKQTVSLTAMACSQRRRHFLVTGPPGVGKTTLIKKVYEQLQQLNISVTGFYTEEVRVNQRRIGFDAITLNGNKAPLARIADPVRLFGPIVGQYTVDVRSFETLVLPLMNNPAPSSVFIIDEIGKMELFSQSFGVLVKKLFETGGSTILATIPVKKGASLPLLDEIRNRRDIHLIEITKENRNSEVNIVTKYISEQVIKTN